jgi:RHS repeat-associated protein
MNNAFNERATRGLERTGRLLIQLRITYLLLIGLFAMCSDNAIAQQEHIENSIVNATSVGTYSISDIEHIDIATSLLGVSVPLMRVGGRGTAGYTMMLPIRWPWHVEHRYFPTQGTWQDHYFPVSNWFQEPPFAAYSPGYMRVLRASDFNGMCGNPGGIQGKVLSKMIFVGADGSTIELIDQRTKATPAYFDGCLATPDAMLRGNVWISNNGSGVTFVSDSNYVETPGLADDQDRFPGGGFLLFPDGTRYRIDGGRVSYIQDRNGNRVSFTYQAIGTNNFGPLLSITDSLNREIDISNGVISFKGSNGANRAIAVGSDTLSNLLVSGQSLQSDHDLFSSLGSDAGTGSYQNPTMPAYVQLPDGRRYNFKYDTHADVARIELPTGGAYEYEWGYSSSPPNIGHYVFERREYPDGGSGNLYTTKTWYGWEGVVSGNVIQKTTVFASTPSGDQPISLSRHYYDFSKYVPPTGFSDPFYSVESGDKNREWKTEIYDASGTTLLQKTETDFEYRESIVVTDANSGPYNTFPRNADYRPIRVTTTLADVSPTLVSKKEFAYDPNVAFTRQTDVYEYDFGSGAPGSFKGRNHTDFLTTNSNQNNANYLDNSIYLRSLPSQSWVSSDINGSTKASLVQYEYDNYVSDTHHAGLITRASVSGFDSSNYGTGNTIRGNLTGVTTFANAANQTGGVSAYSQYDILGNLVKTIDANGNASTISYGDNFGSADPEATSNTAPSQLGGLSAFAFPTIVTNAMGWISYTQYDYYTGAPVNTQDINGIISKIVYNDVLDRPTQKVTAVGTILESQTATVYDDANHRIQTTSDLNGLNDSLLKSESYYDGLGRTIETRKYEANGGYVSVQSVPFLMVQDPLTSQWRAASKTSNPFRPGAGETAVWTTSLSDELGRSIKVITPDSAIIKSEYSGNSTTVTDQAGKLRRSIVNGLGQLTRVDEPNSNGQLGTVASPNQPTAYTYDVLNNLLTVTQNGNTTAQCGGASTCSQSRTFVYNSLSRLTSAANPESGTIGYVYDANGNLTRKTDARGVQTDYVYDVLNRVTNRNYSTPGGTPANYQASPNVTYTYDNVTNAKGKLTKVSTGTGAGTSTTEYVTFDILGRVTQTKQTTDDVTYGNGTTDSPMTYTYNLSGALIQQQYPSGRIVKNVLNNDGTLELVESKKNSSSGYWSYANSFTYNPAGAVTSMQLGNGRWESTQFNSRLQPTRIALGTTPGALDKLQLDYTYSTTANNGNVQSQTITVPGMNYPLVQAYTYDSLNRLSAATETSNSSQTWKQTFTYDRYGNRRFDEANTTMPSSFANQAVSDPTVSTTTNRLTSSGYSYDNAGNTTASANGQSFIYDGENKQIQVNSGATILGQYYYDGDGKRVKKIGIAPNGQAEVTIFVYDAAGKQIAEYSTVVEGSSTAKVNYLTNDHLGSPRINTDANGAIIARHDYHPFGEEIDGTGGRTTGFNYGDDTVRKQFTGYERDRETDLDFAKARYINSTLGRFSSPDYFASDTTVVAPQSWNLYSYARNNPLLYIDHGGRDLFINVGGKDYKVTRTDKAAFILQGNDGSNAAVATAAGMVTRLAEQYGDALRRLVDAPNRSIVSVVEVSDPNAIGGRTTSSAQEITNAQGNQIDGVQTDSTVVTSAANPDESFVAFATEVGVADLLVQGNHLFHNNSGQDNSGNIDPGQLALEPNATLTTYTTPEQERHDVERDVRNRYQIGSLPPLNFWHPGQQFNRDGIRELINSPIFDKLKKELQDERDTMPNPRP